MLKKKDLENFFLILCFLWLYNLPLNIYSVFLHNYETRMLKTYDFCGKESYGYMKYIENKFGNTKKNFHSFNFKDFPSTSSAFIYKLNKNFDDKKFILLNYYSENIKSEKKILQKFGNFRVLDNYRNNCFFIERIN